MMEWGRGNAQGFPGAKTVFAPFPQYYIIGQLGDGHRDRLGALSPLWSHCLDYTIASSC